MPPRTSEATRTKLLDAARDVIRAQGFAATSVDDICVAAGVTKGSFFHHFDSKERLGIAAAEHFEAMADALFKTAPYTALTDPRARLFGYLDLRATMLDGEIVEYTCLLGTLVQETSSTYPAIRAACEAALTEHVEMLASDLAAAKRRYAPDADWSAESVGYFMQSVLQGAFIFAKAKLNADAARDSIAHLRRYLETLLPQGNTP